MEMLAITHSPV